MAPNYRSLVPGGFFSSNPFDRTVPVSIRCNNPGAINGASWEMRYPGYVDTVETTPGNKTTIFEAPEDGVAVWWELLRRYAAAGVTTVGGIINRYGGGQDYSNYIQFVKHKTGFQEGHKISLDDDATLLAFGKAMFQYEAGRPTPLNDNQIVFGFRLARADGDVARIEPAVAAAAPALAAHAPGVAGYVAAAPALAPLAAHAPGIAGAIEAVAIQEWQFFGQQSYDINNHTVRVGHKEGEEGWYERVGTYWHDGVNINGIDGRDHGVPWSAAFISWVMKTAGAGDRFRYSSQHSVYISQAIRDFLQGRAAGFWGRRLNEQKPKVGDLVCWGREAGVDYDHQHGGDYAGHCDIVVDVRPDEVDIVGGNVGDSVTKRPLGLNSGYLKPVTMGGENLFALMENRLDQPVA
jgi:Uncharacterized protein conserved in bacteria (DUF2272)